MTKDERLKIENATVKLVGKKGGQGVLVPGNLIVTAAHCVAYSTEGEMVLGDYFVEPIETASGAKLSVTPLVMEPCSDIAVLGALDDQACPEQCEAFYQWCERTTSVRISTQRLSNGEEIPIEIRTHKGGWIAGNASQFGIVEGRSIWIGAKEQVEPGTSGSPIVNESGELVAIVSHTSLISESLPECSGSNPRPHLALPVWILKLMTPKAD